MKKARKGQKKQSAQQSQGAELKEDRLLDLSPFDRELGTQCGFALASAAEMIAASRSTFDFFRHAQAFLSAVANVSKLFWPDPRGDAARGEKLRLRYSVAEASPISRRDVRNSYDHIDERLDRWSEKDRGMVDLSVGPGPSGGVQVAGGATSALRNFDTKAQTLTFWEDSIHLPSVLAELKRLEDAARKAVGILPQDLAGLLAAAPPRGGRRGMPPP